MDAAWQRRRRDQRAAPGRDEDVDLMNRDHPTDPIEIAILVVGLEVAAVDPCLGGASIVDALLGNADEDVERGIGRPPQTGNGGKAPAPVDTNLVFAGHLRLFMNERGADT